jgi:hypothetical protein
MKDGPVRVNVVVRTSTRIYKAFTLLAYVKILILIITTTSRIDSLCQSRLYAVDYAACFSDLAVPADWPLNALRIDGRRV